MPIWWPRPREPQWMVTTHSPSLQTERIGDGGVEHLGDLLDLEVVVAGAQGPHLLALAPAGVVRDRSRVGVGSAATLLDALKIARPAVALLQGPPGAARQHGGHAGLVERDLAGGADADRDGAKQCLRQRPSDARRWAHGAGRSDACARRRRCRSRRRPPTPPHPPRRRTPPRRRSGSRSPSGRRAWRRTARTMPGSVATLTACSRTFSSMSRISASSA